MLRVAISDRFNWYYKDNYDIFSLKDQVETVNEVQEQVLSIHREKMEEYNERMRKREETNKAHQHYNDLLSKLPKSQQTTFGPLFIESVDERGLNMRHAESTTSYVDGRHRRTKTRMISNRTTL